MPDVSMLKRPLVPAILVCAIKTAGLSTSVIVSVPPVDKGAFVSSRFTVALDKTAASFVPLIVTVTLVSVPSAALTLNVSDTLWPTFKLSNALFAVYVQLPAVSMLKTPLVPATLLCATKVAGLSTSVIVSVPLVDNGAFVSSRFTVALDKTAASFVPLIVTVTLVSVPSAALTLKVSDTLCPTFKLSNALFAV